MNSEAIAGAHAAPICKMPPHPFQCVEGNQFCGACGGGLLCGSHDVRTESVSVNSRAALRQIKNAFDHAENLARLERPAQPTVRNFRDMLAEKDAEIARLNERVRSLSDQLAEELIERQRRSATETK